MYSSSMKILYFGYCFLCIFLAEAESKPQLQITKLFPVQELAAFHQRTNEIKPLDKFLGKLKATYNFVFRKPEDTSNVEKILAKDATNTDVEALKFIWSNLQSVKPMVENSGNEEVAADRSFDTANPKENTLLGEEKGIISEETTSRMSNDEWLDGIEAPKPLAQLELQEDSDDDSEVETATPHTTLQLPVALGRHILEWLGSLLGLTYGAYAKVSNAIRHA